MQSLSRVMPMVTDPDHVKHASQLRELVAAYRDVEDLVSVGAYKPGSQPLSDKALDRWPRINALLRQGKTEPSVYDDVKSALAGVVGD